MAIEWADNFQNYGQNGYGGSAPVLALRDGAYEVVDTNALGISLPKDPDPNISTTVLRFGTTLVSVDSILLRKVYRTFEPTKGTSFRLWFNSLPPANRILPQLRFTAPDSSTLLTVCWTSQGQLQVYQGTPGNSVSPGVKIAETAGPVYTAHAWTHFEIKYTANTTTGSIEIRVEGQTVINLSGANTAPANLNIASLTWGWFETPEPGGYSGTLVHLKDFVMWNTQGAYNNDFLGSVGVYTLRPNADVNTNWDLVGAATRWEALDETTPNDADYISAIASPLPSAYRATLTDLPPDITSVRGLMSVVRARKTDGGDGNLQVGIDSGVATDQGADRPITTAFTYWSDVSEENPATTSPWTPATVNAAGLRINRTL